MIRTRVEQSLFVPGLGHPVHKDGDPRTPVLYRIAAEAGVLGNSLRLLEAIDRIHRKFLGRRLPVNGAGVCGAALADFGIPPHLTRGVSLVARSAGLLGHIAEELRSPIGQQVYDAVDRNAEYSPPVNDQPEASPNGGLGSIIPGDPWIKVPPTPWIVMSQFGGSSTLSGVP